MDLGRGQNDLVKLIILNSGSPQQKTPAPKWKWGFAIFHLTLLDLRGKRADFLFQIADFELKVYLFTQTLQKILMELGRHSRESGNLEIPLRAGLDSGSSPE
jgi:hypothetical protein